MSPGSALHCLTMSSLYLCNSIRQSSDDNNKVLTMLDDSDFAFDIRNLGRLEGMNLNLSRDVLLSAKYLHFMSHH